MRRSNWRVNGPYKHGNKWRVAFSRGSGRERETRYEVAATQAEAESIVAGARDESQGFTVRMAVDEFLEAKRPNVEATTLENYEHRLWRLLGLPGNSTRPVRWTVGRAAELYRLSIGDGANDTHINGLNVGRMWGSWCVKKRILKVNPFADVEAVGRKVKGSSKPRLTVNESRQLEAYCFEHADNPDCVLTYGYLMLGKRASELVRVTARDLDDDGWLLIIRKAKSDASVKPIGVPERLRDMLLALAKGKPSGAHLFLNMSGKPMSRFVARDRVLGVLKAAKVSVLPPQALRRTFTDNAERQGFSLRSIAEMVGHTSVAVTERSYVSPERVEQGAVERNFKVLAGGRR